MHAGLPAQNSLRTYFACHTRHLRGKRAKLIDHHIDRIFQLKKLTFHIDRDLLGQIAIRYRGRYRRDVADLRREIPSHEIHVFG